MDSSLFLLMRLRARAMGRRWKLGLSRPKGIVMLVFAALAFAPMVASGVVTAFADIRPPLGPIRRFAPLGLAAFAAFSVLLSAGEQALYYSPAEVTFLFAGPYRKRQLLAYKLVTLALLSLLSAAFFGLMGRAMSPGFLSALVGSFLLVFFLQVLQMAIGLGASTLGALAWSRGRRLFLAALAVGAAAFVASVGRDLTSGGAMAALGRVEASTTARVALAPFRWFILAFTAERVWPDLIRWSALGLVVNGALVALVFALDASYLEAASAASARRFSKLRKMVAGGGTLRSVRRPGAFRFRPPAAPWWGGVGPNFWRQMTSALGDPGRLAGLVGLISMTPAIMFFIGLREPRQAEAFSGVSLGMIGWMSLVLSILIPYDFRGDIDMMEELKTLPIPPTRLALGQLLTPTLVATASQAIAVLGVVAAWGSNGGLTWAMLAFLLPVNLLFYGVENLMFLWYPSRVVAGQFDLMAVGRQVVFMLGKFLGLGLGVGLASLAGAAVYFLPGSSIAPALVAAWVALAAVALGLVPLVGRAFRQFDVTRDVPA